MPPPVVPAERLQRVDAARQQWIRKLVDLSRRNNLLYFRDLQVGTLDLSASKAEVIQRLLQSHRLGEQPVRLSELVDEASFKKASGSFREITRKAQINFEERGLDTLFLALGLATWRATDDGRPAAAPVLLVPIDAKPAGGASTNWTIARSGEVRLNDVLIHALQEEHSVRLDADSLLRDLQGDDEGESFDPAPFFASISGLASRVPDFDIEPRWVVGNFAFQKMAIVNDLKNLGNALAAHDLVSAIAGDSGALAASSGQRVSVEASELDAQPPDNEFLIRDADSSQHRAIEATLRGQNGVISGPPGTGKSQTIANLIAELVARGKTVLFVAEKRAALDVVLDRLEAADLGHLCLDCHGAELTRRRVAEQLQESLERLRDAPVPDVKEVHRKLTDRRGKLNEHASLMNTKVQPWGLTPCEIYGHLLRLPDGIQSSARIPRAELSNLTLDRVEQALEDVDALIPLSDLVTGTSSSPWLGAVLTTPDDARHVVERARAVAGVRWMAWEEALLKVAAEANVRVPGTTDGVNQLLGVLIEVQELLAIVREELFQVDLPTCKAALAPASSAWGRLWARVSNPQYRQALKAVRGGSVDPKCSDIQALDSASRSLELLGKWREASEDPQGMPKRLVSLEDAVRTWRDVKPDLLDLLRFFPETEKSARSLSACGSWLGALAIDAVTPARIVKVHDLKCRLTVDGFGAVLPLFAAGKTDPDEWPSILRATWLQSCLEEAQLRFPDLPSFSGRRHDTIAREFRALDAERLKLAVQRVQRSHALRALAARNAHPGQDQTIRKEAQKKSRHLPLRKLFAEAPDVLLGLRPCWMASPLSVSQLTPGDRQLFDVVVFDEASQVLPEDAITSLLRGKQAVIAGDRKQLPPTTFFAAGDIDTDDDEDATAGFQSILDVMSSFLEPAWHLDWHYRSRDEALIAYSNHHIYSGRLVTFPGPAASEAVRHILVPHEPGQGAQQASVAAEVRQVVELIRQHAAELICRAFFGPAEA